MRHSTVYATLCAEKLNLLNKSCFYPNNVRCQNLLQLSEVQSFGLDTGPQSFCYSSMILDQYLASSRAVMLRPPGVINTVPPDRGKLVTCGEVR